MLAVLCLAGKAQLPVSEQFHLDMEELRDHLAKAPFLNAATATEHSSVKILLPTPDGTLLPFQIWEDPILSADLQLEYPNCHTYTLQGEDQPFSGRLMISPSGLDAVVLCGEQVLFIEAVDAATDLHRVYYWKLGSNYLSFNTAAAMKRTASGQSIRLAILVDDEYARYHGDDLARAVFSSVNGVSAFLELSQGIHLDLQYFAPASREQVLNCRVGGFQGRTAESLKLFGDAIADGKLQLADFDLGQLFSGRGFGGSALAGVAGVDTYYDWNEDGVYDGPAKAGGGLGAARPEGANWWGNLCKEITRQIKSSDLALTVQQPSPADRATRPEQTAYLGNLEHFPFTMKHYSGPGTMGEIDFPHLSCLPFSRDNVLSLHPRSYTIWGRAAFPRLQSSLTGSALLPLWLTQPEESFSLRNWMLGWRL